MSRAWRNRCVLCCGGAACVGVGLAFGVALNGWALNGWASSGGHERLWREPAMGPAPIGTVPLVPSFRDVVDQVGPSVVSVRAQLLDPDAASTASGVVQLPRGVEHATSAGATSQVAANPVFAAQPGVRNGSGFVIHEDGLVLTSRHVVVDAHQIRVRVPQFGELAAELVGEDRATDLALLRLVRPPAGLPAVALGGSEDLRAGDWIVAVGNPFGLTRTVTAGVVSFVGRHLLHTDVGVTSDFLQISAPINPGSSGCPVIDVHGRVVGVTTQVAAAAQGMAFAVPSHSVKWALQEMQRQPDGRVRRGYLGIEFASLAGLDEAGQPAAGAVIVRVAKDEPAARAGLREGDVVLAVDGEPVRDAKHLHERIVMSDPDTRLSLKLLRDGRIEDSVVAVLGEIGRDPATAPF